MFLEIVSGFIDEFVILLEFLHLFGELVDFEGLLGVYMWQGVFHVQKLFMFDSAK